MANKAHFQWQNEHLLKTIYPLREMKLRDFLVYYFEIDIWQLYKDKTVEDISSEARAYQLAQSRQWREAYDRYSELRAYFLKADVTDEYRQKFPEMDEAFMVNINKVHKSFNTYFEKLSTPARERYFITARANEVEKNHYDIQKEIADKERAVRNMGPDWYKKPLYEADINRLKNITSKMLEEERTRINDFLAAFDKLSKSRDELNKWTTQLEKERANLERDLNNKNYYVKRYPDRPQYQQEAQELEKQLSEVNARLAQLNALPEKDQLLSMTTSHDVSVKDIVHWKVDIYRDSLLKKDHQELLELVVQRFLKKPEDYPLWLQYMVIHFSGMRYKSAHGSWADPRELLQSLKINDVEKSLKLAPDETIEAYCQEKVEEYELKLTQTTDQTQRDKIRHYLEGLGSTSPYRRRSTLLDVRFDEENEKIDGELSDEEVLEELQGMKDELPPWMWKQIVARTALRLEEVTQENWEDYTPEELQDRADAKWAAYRDIMNKWTSDNLTSWRAEHDRANRLIVTRAVCNEVAEHIQHLRGHTPPGGLTAKPEWYLRLESNPQFSSAADRPFFVKPLEEKDYKAGASILWLRWVDGEPNAWRIAHPLTLKNGEGLLPGDLTRGGARARDQAGSARTTTDWEYTNTGSAFQRNRVVVTEEAPDQSSARKTGKKKKTVRTAQRQWLRWMHEATIAKVADTADGKVVLTFETALPYEDKRHSTIGVFKHSIYDLKYSVSGTRFNGTFVGYVPETQLPMVDLEEMLDWNKIMNKDNFISQARMDAYWAKMAKKSQDPVSFSTPSQDRSKTPGQSQILPDSVFEAMPEVQKTQHKEFIQCYDVDAHKRTAKRYTPKVEIPRGVHMYVSKKGAQKVGTYTYYPIIRCDAEPRAQDLYVRSDHVMEIPRNLYVHTDSGIELPVEKTSKPVETNGDINLRLIKNANDAGKPVMEFPKPKITLSDGTPMRVSTVHKATPSDAGNGVIDVDGKVDYYLITECPWKSDARGLFIQVPTVEPISEEEYKLRSTSVPQEDITDGEIQVKVTPKDNAAEIYLFEEQKPTGKEKARAGRHKKKAEPIINKSYSNKLPKDIELTVASKPTVSSEKEYYRILDCPLDVKYAGLYVLTKEVTQVLEK